MSEYDVIQVGYGPVGQLMAALLGKLGHRVAVFERHPSLYSLPRAGHVEDDIVRLFQSIGAADEVVRRAWALKSYRVLDANREVLVYFDWDYEGPSGWHGHYNLYQPCMEDALDRAARRHPSVEVCQGYPVEEVRQDAGGAEVTVRHPDGRSLTARGRYLVGTDGANSIVRRAAGIEQEDLGFHADFLVLDVRPRDPEAEWDVFEASQICDIQRPTTAIRRLGREHARWEYMLLPGESPDEMASPEACWRLLETFGVTPENASLIRHVVYTFQSLLSETFRQGPFILVGDAAHLMPPFMGQGMCSGMRDAAALAWRLDLVLRGIAGRGLLDSYSWERRPHVRRLILDSMNLGQVVCTLDPVVAAARDRALRSGTAPPPEPTPGLVEGLLQSDCQRHPGVGRPSLQAVVRSGQREGKFDDIVGAGWTLLLAAGTPAPELPPGLGEIGLKVVRFGDRVVDAGRRYAAWFAELGVEGVLVRPDFYVFGVARTAAEAPALVADLLRQLGVKETAGA